MESPGCSNAPIGPKSPEGGGAAYSSIRHPPSAGSVGEKKDGLPIVVVPPLAGGVTARPGSVIVRP